MYSVITAQQVLFNSQAATEGYDAPPKVYLILNTSTKVVVAQAVDSASANLIVNALNA